MASGINKSIEMDPIVKTTLIDLPTEVLHKICEYLTFFELITFGDTSKYLNAVTVSVLAMRTELNMMTYKFKDPDDYDGKKFLKASKEHFKCMATKF